MADATLDHHDMLFLREIEPSIFQDRNSSYHGSLPRRSSVRDREILRGKFSRLSAFLQQAEHDGEEALLNSQLTNPKSPTEIQRTSTATDRPVSNPPAPTHPCTADATPSTDSRPAPSPTTAGSDPTATATGAPTPRSSSNRPAAWTTSTRGEAAEAEERTENETPERDTNSSGDTESEEDETETTVRLLWMSMLKMPKKLFRLCVCHLVTWFSIIAEAVFYTDFMGQVIYEGDPTVSDALLFLMHLKRLTLHKSQLWSSYAFPGNRTHNLSLLIPCYYYYDNVENHSCSSNSRTWCIGVAEVVGSIPRECMNCSNVQLQCIQCNIVLVYMYVM